MTGRLEDYPMAHDIEDRVFGAAQLPQDGPMASASMWRGIKGDTGSVEDAILRLIRKAESGNCYDAFFAFKNPVHKPLSEMTLAEVRAYQEGFARARGKSTAAGAYQIIRATLDSLMEPMRLLPSVIFNKATQDAMAVRLLERRGLHAFKSGAIPAKDFAHALSKEWASLPRVLGDNPDASYYAGDGINHARVSVADILRALEG